LVSISRNEGGDVGLKDAEAGGMRATLGGRDAVMMESPSPSSRTDDGRCEASLESGLWVIGVGDFPRGCAFGIMLVSGQSRTNWAYLPEQQTESRANKNGRISLLFITSDPA
jgi:hypothetical protein